jgi:hypothetical protein
MKLGIIISTKEPETAFNALRLGNYALGQGDSVQVSLLGQGVELDQIESSWWASRRRIAILSQTLSLGRHRREDQRRGQCERRAPTEGSHPTARLIHRAENQAGRQRADTDRKIVPPVGESSPLRADQACHQRLLGRFGEDIEDRIQQEENPDVPSGRGESERDVDHRVETPAHEDHRPRPDPEDNPPGQPIAAALGHMEHAPQDGQQPMRDAGLAGAHQQEGVARIPQGEHQQGQQVDAISWPTPTP